MQTLSTEALLAKYDRPVPRYTSFPTAPHFNDSISTGQHHALLQGLESQAPLSLYIHIPFCHSLCYYCGCHTKIVGSLTPVRAYFDMLLREIDTIGMALLNRIPVARIHFGGGSPNFAASADLGRVLDQLARYFRISEQTLIDMEADPRLLNTEKIGDYAQIGFNRISLGVQDFNPDVQKAVNRIQSYDHVVHCVEDLRRAGITQINFDLMTGLPFQTPESVAQTAQQAAGLAPDRLAVFPYAHVPWMKKAQKLLEKYTLPDRNNRHAMMQAVRTQLVAHGYHTIGIDHFARRDDPLYHAWRTKSLRRNFQGYTEDQAETILGFGLSAISSFPLAYVQNTTDAPAYRQAIEKGHAPIRRGCLLTREDQKRRALISDLMCYFTVDLGDYPEIEIPQAELSALEQDGIVTCRDRILNITVRGRAFARIVATCFDPYFDAQENRHAKAV